METNGHNRERDIDIAQLKVDVAWLKSNQITLMENHLPHIEKRLGKIEKKLAYWAGGLGVGLGVLQLILYFI